MRFKPLACVVAVCGVIFISGVAVGQRTPTFKFAKYLQPAVRDDMYMIALQVNVESIRESVPMDGISIPDVFYNSSEHRPQASAFVSRDFEKASLDEVRGKITERYYLSYSRLKNFIPELSEDDFVLTINRFTTDSANKLFAECRHGNIVFH
jgi:hypothetical protein